MRKVLLIIIGWWLALGAYAQAEKIKEIFLQMPQKVAPMLTQEMRSALLQSYEKNGTEGTPKEVRNLFNGVAKVISCSNRTIEVQLDSQSTLQLQQLPLRGKRYLIGAIFTSKLAPEQSVLLLYSQEWQRLELAQYLEPIALADFLKEPALLQQNKVKKVLGEIGSLNYRYRWEEGKLKVELTNFATPINKKLYPEATEWLKPGGITYNWDRRKGGKLKKER